MERTKERVTGEVGTEVKEDKFMGNAFGCVMEAEELDLALNDEGERARDGLKLVLVVKVSTGRRNAGATEPTVVAPGLLVLDEVDETWLRNDRKMECELA